MNGISIEAQPQLGCEGGVIITSLTSRSKMKPKSGHGNEISLSEALATSVAEYVCDKQRRIHARRGAVPSSASSSAKKETETTTKMASMEVSNSTRSMFGLVSAGEDENNSTLLASDAERIISDSTISSSSARSVNRDSPDSMEASDSHLRTNSRSSMSYAVADLASGMRNFFGNGGEEGSSGGKNSNYSAPIISGTAAAVLALQQSASACTSNPHYDNIVSSNSVMCSNNDSSSRQQSSSEQRKIMIAAAASAIAAGMGEGVCDGEESITLLKHVEGGIMYIADSDTKDSSPTSTTTSADGAPIIDGTASAQMKAIIAGGDILAINGESHQRLGFPLSGRGETRAGTNFATITRQDSNVLSWVDHCSNSTRVTPDDRSFANDFCSLGSSSCCQLKSSLSSRAVGGMNILAEITCHAPPLPLPLTLSHTTNNMNSYSQQHSIPSQESSDRALSSSSSQEQHSHVHQALQHDLFRHEPENTKNVLAIPSYQEIYREMGLTPDERHHFSQHHLSSGSYSIDSHQLDSFHPHATQCRQYHNLSPSSDYPMKLISRTPFGHVSRDDIEEGKGLYSRKDLSRFGGHISEAKDVTGNMKDGCASLVLGNLEKDLRECDGLLWFLYSTDRANGGGALCRSYHSKRPIRIFRSSLLGGKYAPPFLDVEDDFEEDSDVAYRYDGLYMVRAVWDIHGSETETHPVCGENGWQTYFCTRLPRRPLEEEKREDGMEYNAMGCQELWSTIQKMRGVRKPRKFDIPPPPVKLGPLRNCAISGAFKDRKAAGFVKPAEETHIATPRQRPNSKSPRTVPAENVDNGDGKSVSEIVDQQQQLHMTQLVDSSPCQMLTQRPRLNYMLESNSALPSSHHFDAESSDSELSSSASQVNSKQSKRRKTTPNPKYSNENTVSAYIPKRATAAKAEAANRDMFVGSKSLKRNSSDSATSLALTTKARYIVDQSIITVGSRVLVAYKGSLYKATIRRRREKDGTHDFLIHYDGNKKSNVHWIAVNDINKILEINVDAPPKKNSPTASGVVWIKGLVKEKEIRASGKRKSPVPLEESDTNDDQAKPSGDTLTNHVGGTSEMNDYTSERKSCSVMNDDQEKPSGEAVTNHVPLNGGGKSDMNNNASEMKSFSVVENHKDVSQPMPCMSETIISPPNADAIRKPRESVVSDVYIVESHNSLAKCTAAEWTPAESDDDGSRSESDNNPTSITAIPKGKSEPITASKFPVGAHVYVEYRQIFYSSTILKTRRKRGGAGGSNTEYLVHYEGYKKSSNTWVKEATLHEVNALTTKRFERQRVTTADKPQESEQPLEFSKVQRTKNTLVGNTLLTDNVNHSTTQKKPPTPKLRSDESDAALKSLKSGVAFLVGSMVFVEWTGALFLAKMLKKRYSGDRTEYLISYDGYNSNHDAWVSINKIYEVNPQTKRVYKKLNVDMCVDGKEKKCAPPRPVPEQREARKKAQDDDAAAREVETNSPSPFRASSRAAAKSGRAASSLHSDMKGIDSGVEFLPGSTIFAEYKGGLCLAKMMKKRGKGDYMEYLVQYNGLKKSVEAWVSTALIYEINPQTKRMFRELAVSKK